MRASVWLGGLAVGIVSLLQAGRAAADPCGMVPPIYEGNDVPIARVGLQKTYVFYKDGIETFVIRPGFSGKVEEFGMLIPFPTVPAIRKVPDNIFTHIAAAVDPPEVIVDVRPVAEMEMMAASAAPAADAAVGGEDDLAIHAVRVLKQEAVGMYEVAVLAAGSAEGLKQWLEDHGYVYPAGMDKPCNDYVQQGWCFVAVKTRVGQKSGVDPKPGARDVEATMPDGSVFDGNVQGMGFRFKSPELVVPMRLSAFNKGDLHNVVYLLSDEPQRVNSISTKSIVRQIAGDKLFQNVTGPLPLRIIGGTEEDIPDWRKKTLPRERKPEPHNGLAGELFASDLLAVNQQQLSLPHEETEKMLLNVSERLGLRGAGIDKLNMETVKAARQQVVKDALSGLETMTLTVVDGDFPRDVIAKDNLTFTSYKMAAEINTGAVYDAKLFAPAPKREGELVDDEGLSEGVTLLRKPVVFEGSLISPVTWALLGVAGLFVVLAVVMLFTKNSKQRESA